MKKLLFLLLILPAFASAQTFDQDLYYGMQENSSVKELQEFLTDNNFYSGPITGNFFSLTLAGVKKFQAANSITPLSGYFGPKSRGRANEILAQAGVSNNQVVTESGTTASVSAAPANTTNDVVNSLNEQIKILQQQLALLQQQQTTLQQQNQQITQQTQTLQQIQQQTAQPAPNSTSNSTPSPVVTPISQASIKIIQVGGCSSDPTNSMRCTANDYKINPNGTLAEGSKTPNDSNLIIFNIFIRDGSGNPIKDAEVSITATDSNQNKILKGTGVVTPIYENGIKKIVPVYSFSYELRTVGQHKITVAANGMTENFIVNAQ